MTEACPLCKGHTITPYHQDERREYLECEACKLVFVPKKFHLDAALEKAQYDLHENDPNDVNYRKFLSKIYTPLNALLKPNSKGLDFGSGPGPTLSLLFKEAGHKMDIYDIFYAPNKNVLKGGYDFITATEVVEHLSSPMQVLDMLWGLVKPGGYLGLMTQFNEGVDFKNWHYKIDPTHICFFKPETFGKLTKKWEAEISFSPPNSVIFQKSV